MAKEIDLPSDQQIEREILRCCFSDDPTAFNEVRMVLDPRDWAFDDHRRIFQSLCRLTDAGEPRTIAQVAQELQARNESFPLTTIIEAEEFRWALGGNLRKAKEMARRRHLVHYGSAVSQLGTDRSAPLDETLQWATAGLKDILAGGVDETPQHVGSIIETAGGMDGLLSPARGIQTPWPEFDQCTGGWQKGDLIVLAARPSMGKTALALNILLHAALRGTPVAFYSYEMSQPAVVIRLISLLTGISCLDLRRDLTKDERRSIRVAIDSLVGSRLYVVRANGMTALALRCHIEKLKHKADLELVAVDYLGLIRGNGQANRNQEVGEMCRQTKDIASETAIPVIMLSQLSRATETRPDKRPVLSDLRDSGEIENHADLIAFLYRPGYYDRQNSSLRHVAELSIAKQRNGDTFTLPLVFRRECGLFESELSPGLRLSETMH